MFMTDLFVAPPVRGEAPEPFVSFRREIFAAMAHATPYDEHEDQALLVAAQTAPEVYQEPDHEEIVNTWFIKQPHEVVTTDPEEYRILLAEATAAIWEAQDDWEIESLEEIMSEDDYLEAYEHEMTHAEVAQRFGNQHTTVFYGVEFKLVFQGGEWHYDFIPFVDTRGPLKKIHSAWMSLAPRDPSPTDLNNAREQGYDPNEKEYIRLLAESISPVGPEHWPRPPIESPAAALTIAILAQLGIGEQR